MIWIVVLFEYFSQYILYIYEDYHKQMFFSTNFHTLIYQKLKVLRLRQNRLKERKIFTKVKHQNKSLHLFKNQTSSFTITNLKMFIVTMEEPKKKKKTKKNKTNVKDKAILLQLQFKSTNSYTGTCAHER